MKKRKKSQETPQMRVERVQLSKCMQTKSIKNKKKYDRKRDNQKIIPSFLSFSLLIHYISNVSKPNLNGDIMLALISNLSTETEYLIASADGCRDATDKSAYESYCLIGETITMGSVIVSAPSIDEINRYRRKHDAIKYTEGE